MTQIDAAMRMVSIHGCASLTSEKTMSAASALCGVRWQFKHAAKYSPY